MWLGAVQKEYTWKDIHNLERELNENRKELDNIGVIVDEKNATFEDVLKALNERSEFFRPKSPRYKMNLSDDDSFEF